MSVSRGLSLNLCSQSHNSIFKYFKYSQASKQQLVVPCKNKSVITREISIKIFKSVKSHRNSTSNNNISNKS